MKKLTAGIFASILGLTAMGAADAAVTSRAYVDAAIKTVSTTADGLAQRVTNIETEQITQNNSIKDNADAIDAIEADYLKAADKTELTNALDGKQDLLQTSMFTRDGEGNVVTGITATDGKVTLSTASVATSEELTNLDTRVATAEGKITAIEGEQTTQNNAIDAVEGRMDTAEGKISTIETQQTTQDGLIEDNAEAAAAAQADATKALEALKDTSKMADGNYALTMKVENGVPKYGWEYIDRTFEAGEDASTGDTLDHDETTTTQG